MKRVFSIVFILNSIIATGQDLSWFNRLGYTGDQAVNGLRLDSQGNIVVCGNFKDSIDLDPSPDTLVFRSQGGYNIFFAKYTPMGDLIWGKALFCTGSSSYVSGDYFHLDSAGNILLTAEFSDSIDVDPSLNQNFLVTSASTNIFFAKYDLNGNLIQSFICGTGGNVLMVGNKLINNSIYISGVLNGTHDFDPSSGTFQLSSGAYNFFVAKYTLSGNLINAIILYSSQSLNGSPPIKANDGGLIFTGDFRGTVDFDPSGSTFNLSSGATYRNVYLLKLDTNLNFTWAKMIGNGNSNDNAHLLENVDSSNVIIAGSFTGTSDFDPGAAIYNVTAPASNCGFLAKYDSIGNFLSVKILENSGGENGISIIREKSGYYYAGINFSGSVDVDLSPGGQANHTSFGHYDFAVVKYDKNFNYIWSIQGGSSSWDYVWDILLPTSDKIIFSGTFTNTLSLDSNLFVSNGDSDGYFAQVIQDTCSTFGIRIDSLFNNTCTDFGFANSSAFGAIGSPQYLWTSVPPSTDSFAYFTNAGIYTLQVTDSIGCIRERNVLVDGPSVSGIDLIVNANAGNFRSGFSSNIWPNGFNDGCNLISGTLYCVLDPLLTYNYAIPTPDSISGDTLFWNFTDLIYDSLHITPIINVTTNAQIGDTVCFEVKINPINGDADSSNNYKNYCFPVVNGYDPNFKQVYPQGECIPNYVLNEKPLTYTVHFQNTGNADAINMHILDTLDTNLDLNTLRVIGNSHYVITEILPGNVMDFRFDNIHLPDSGSNELLSHGYVIYEVSPLVGTPDFTAINNTSHIYFDFNPAIITNTTLNTLVDSIPSFSTSENISVCYNSEYTMPDGTNYSNITLPFTHHNNLWMVDGCDSIITTNISVNSVIDLTTSQNNVTLSANLNGMYYQWINCTTNLPITNATNQNFTATVNGNYAVIINDGNCSDTSACTAITTLGWDENHFNNSVKIYPNPANEIISIEFSTNENTVIEIHNIAGEIVRTINSHEKLIKADIRNLSNGLYFISVSSETENGVFKFVKE